VKRLSFVVFLLLCLMGVSVNAQEETPEATPETAVSEQQGLTASRLDRLSRGINLSRWYWFGPPTVEQIRSYYNADDFNYLRELGFRHVRIPVDLNMVYDERYADFLSARIMPVLEGSIQNIIDAELGVIIDLHSTSLDDASNSVYSGRLETEPAFVDNYVTFWKNFAGRLSQFDPEYLFFEPMNEPVFQDDPTAWWPIQERLIGAIRESAPDHTIIATAAFWSGIFTLVKMEPLDDPNVVYNFHFYEPFIFTHQGADWIGQNVARNAQQIPYPSNPRKIEPALSLAEGNDALTTAIRNYGDALWDSQKIEDEVAWAASWARRHGVHLVCTEFGVYKQFAPVVDREQWFKDVRNAFEEYGVGWTMWEYVGDFGLAERNRGVITHDEGVAAALGLRSDQQAASND
jgi:endoglucanase